MSESVDYKSLQETLAAGIDEGHSKPVAVEGEAAALIEKLHMEQQSRPKHQGDLSWKNFTAAEVEGARANARSLGDKMNLARAWLKNKLNAVANTQGFPDEQTKEAVKEAAREGLKKTGGLSGQEIDDLIRNVIDPIRVRG